MVATDTTEELVVLPLDVDHWPAVTAIYQAGIDSGHATFEAAPPTWDAA